MKISVTRSGGFAGTTENLGAIDTAQLPAEIGEELRRMIEKAGKSSPTSEPSKAVVGADMFRYEIAMIDGPKRQTMTFIDDGSPAAAALHTLIDRVASLRS